MTRVQVHSDGGARGNPGPAAIGVVLEIERDGRLELAAEIGETIGVATNNVAEYRALIRGLEEAARLGASEVTCLLDSQLVVEQLSGRYKVKNANIAGLHRQAADLARSFKKATFRYVPRAENAEADRLVNAALDGKPSGISPGGARVLTLDLDAPAPAARPAPVGARGLLEHAFRDAVEIPRLPLARLNRELPTTERYTSEDEAWRARWAIAQALGVFAVRLGLVDRAEVDRLEEEFAALRPF